MMSIVNSTRAGRSPQCRLLQGALALALGVAAWTAPALAGQATDTFRVTVDLRPPGPGTCSATIGSDGKPRVDCSPGVIVGAGAGGSAPGSSSGASGDLAAYRLLDARIKHANALVEVGEGSYFAWGEYSSRLMLAGQLEYVEMRVTW